MSTTENTCRDPINVVRPPHAHAGSKVSARTSECFVYLARCPGDAARHVLAAAWSSPAAVSNHYGTSTFSSRPATSQPWELGQALFPG